MFDFIKNLDGIYYVLWGIGALGLLMKIFANTYLKGLLKASENMATTKRKMLRVMRQKYENGRSLGLRTGDGQAFVEKNVRSVKLLFVPIEIYSKIGRILLCPLLMTIGINFLRHDASWRGSPMMIDIFANGIVVGAFLLLIENIFLLNNKLEIMKANIRDYFENGVPKREVTRRQKVLPEPEIAASVDEEMNEKQSDEVLNRFLQEFFS